MNGIEIVLFIVVAMIMIAVFGLVLYIYLVQMCKECPWKDECQKHDDEEDYCPPCMQHRVNHTNFNPLW